MPHKRVNQGVSLIELMAVIMLLALGIVPILSVLSGGVSADRAVEYRAVADTLAQQKMETLRSVALTAVVDVPREDVGGTSFFSMFDWEVAVTGTDPKDVTVTVYWNFEGAEQSSSLRALMTAL